MRLKPLRAFFVGFTAVFLGAILKVMKFEESVYLLATGTLIQIAVIIYVLKNYTLVKKTERKL